MRKETELRSYQGRCADWLYERDCGIAVLDLGAGKTAIALTAVNDLIRDGVIRHALIIPPLRVAHLVWPAELQEWEHLAGLKMAVLAGGPAERKRLLGCASTRQLTVCNIDNAQWLCAELEKLPDDSPLFDLLIVDETSKLKSPQSKRARALAKLAPRFRNRWGLTGTPRPNSERDLFQQAKVISAGRLWGNSYDRWLRQRFDPVDIWGSDYRIKPAWAQRTNDEFASIAITLAENDMPDLPDLNVVIEPVSMPAHVRPIYHTMEKHLLADLGTKSIEAISDMVATGKLAQIVSGFLYDDDENGRVVEDLHEAKLEWLDETVESLGGQSLLVVYEFQHDASRLIKRYACPVIGGGTSAAEAAAAIEAWNSGRLPMLAIHPASAGHGLNLQKGGAHLAWLGLTWSPEQYEQTTKRIYRPGQTRHVTIHIPLMGGTVDELKRFRVIDKLSRQDAFKRYLPPV